MLDWIISIAEGLFNFFERIGAFFDNIIAYGALLTKAVTSLPSYLNWLPASAGATIALVIAVAVIAKVVGRDG